MLAKLESGKKMATGTQEELQVNKKLVFSAYRDPFYYYSGKSKKVEISIDVVNSEFNAMTVHISEFKNNVDGYSQTELNAQINFTKSEIQYSYTHKYVKTSLPNKYSDINKSETRIDNELFFGIDELEIQYIDNYPGWKENKLTEEQAKKMIEALVDYLLPDDIAKYVINSLTEDYRRVEVKVEDLGDKYATR